MFTDQDMPPIVPEQPRLKVAHVDHEKFAVTIVVNDFDGRVKRDNLASEMLETEDAKRLALKAAHDAGWRDPSIRGTVMFFGDPTKIGSNVIPGRPKIENAELYLCVEIYSPYMHEIKPAGDSILL